MSETASEWKSLSLVWLFVTPWTVASQVPLSMEFSQPEYWSGLPCPPPGDIPDPGIKPESPALQADSLLSEPPQKPQILHILGWGSHFFSFLSLEQRFLSLDFVYFKWFVRFTYKHNSKPNSSYFNTMISHVNNLCVMLHTNSFRNNNQIGFMFS